MSVEVCLTGFQNWPQTDRQTHRQADKQTDGQTKSGVYRVASTTKKNLMKSEIIKENPAVPNVMQAALLIEILPQ